MAAIPGSPDEVTAHWLTEVLSRPGAPVVVEDVEVTPIGTGQTGATYRIAACYGSSPTSPTELPDSFVVKLPAQEEAVRERVALSYRSEYAFYTAVVDTVAVPVPHCYYCALADDGAEFVLLLADMAPAQQGDQIRGCTPAEAELAATALAGLHGPRWCDPAWLSFTGTVMPKPDEAGARGLGDITRLAASTTIENSAPE